MLLRCLSALLVLALIAPLTFAQGETIIVDDTPDSADFGGAQQVADLPGPDGRTTLREAIIAANNTPGPQTIHFNIPQSRWPALYDDLVLVYSYSTPFVITDDSLTIDGTSQTAFTGDTNPDGNEVGFWGEHPNALGSPLFSVSSDHNTFKGLDVMHRRGYGISFSQTAEHNRVIGNTISAPLYAAVRIQGSHNTVGGTEPGEGNRLSSGNDGVRIERTFNGSAPTANRIVGNYLTGSVSGVHVRDGAVGTVIGGPTPEERNVIADVGYYGGEGYPIGAMVAISDATDTVIEGNYVGLTADGMASAVQVGTVGIGISSSENTLVRGNAIGGIRVEGRNHHAGDLFGWGLTISGASDGTVVTENTIGTSADGTVPVPNLNGVWVSSGFNTGPPTNTILGGTALGAGNVVAHSERTGIIVTPGSSSPITGVAILGNAVFANGDLGIDLDLDGPTANDASDADGGTNRLQNHPVIESASLSGGMLTVTYSVDTALANATYPLRVEFFEADPDGEEGQRFLGTDTYAVPGQRTATFTVSGLNANNSVLGTATDEAGNTSEFGAPTEVTGGSAMAVTASPMNTPVVIPSGGGSFEFSVTLTNATAQTQSVQAWSEVVGPVSRSPIIGPVSATLPPGGTVTRVLTQQVPGAAPPGSYTYMVHIGSYGAAVMASSGFAVEKSEAGIGTPRSGDASEENWSVHGWDEVEAQSVALPGGFTLSAVYPNPSASQAQFELEVAEAQHVEVSVYDALGRRVALLHDGLLGVDGAHAFTLSAAGLSPGVYLVRASGETFVATRRLTLMR